ncbi:MAG: TonB-dependent receptor, partial [Planctomycetes bacterium]|nr:TonB-dependent receptor [Planctomycetota bacterium]
RGGQFVNFVDGMIGAPNKIAQHAARETWTMYDGFSGHRLRLGAGFKYFKVEPERLANFGTGVIDGSQPIVDDTLTDVTDTPFVYIPEVDRKVWFVLVQDEWSFARNWELTAGVRYDHYSDFGGTFNPRVAVVWETRYDLITKLLYGSAFRAPAFLELYSQNNPSAMGNPSIEPETINTLELAFDYQPTTNLHIVFNLFANEIKNMIDIVEGERTFDNTRDQEGYGFELEADWEATEDIRLYGNVAWHHAEDKDTGDSVPNAPQLQ